MVHHSHRLLDLLTTHLYRVRDDSQRQCGRLTGSCGNSEQGPIIIELNWVREKKEGYSLPHSLLYDITVL